MQSHDLEYYRDRAAAERKLAELAENPNVAAIHEELALQYEALIEQAERRPRLLIATVHASGPRNVPRDS